MNLVVTPRLPVGADRPGSVVAEIGPLPGFDDHPVAWFRGSVTAQDTASVARLIHKGVEAGLPVVGVVERMGLDAGVDRARHRRGVLGRDRSPEPGDRPVVEPR